MCTLVFRREVGLESWAEGSHIKLTGTLVGYGWRPSTRQLRVLLAGQRGRVRLPVSEKDTYIPVETLTSPFFHEVKATSYSHIVILM